MIEAYFFNVGSHRNTCLWFQIVFPLAQSMAGRMSPLHIQPNVTISGEFAAHISNTKLLHPGMPHSAFYRFRCGCMCPPKQRQNGSCNSIQITYTEKHSSNMWINGFLCKLSLTHLYLFFFETLIIQNQILEVCIWYYLLDCICEYVCCEFFSLKTVWFEIFPLQHPLHFSRVCMHVETRRQPRVSCLGSEAMCLVFWDTVYYWPGAYWLG